MDILKDWFRRHFSNPQVIILAVCLVIGFALVLVLGKILTPVIAGLVIAYLLEAIIGRLERYRIPRMLSVPLVVGAFFTLVLMLMFVVIPLLSQQMTQVVQRVPDYLNKLSEVLLHLPEQYPNMISEQQVSSLLASLRDELAAVGQRVITQTIASVIGVLTLVVFVFLVPILVFFFLKDKQLILNWFRWFLPKDRLLVSQIWKEVDAQIGNYVRGKSLEILLVGTVSYITFAWMGLDYSALLSAIVGLSVVIPYIGAVVATLPVAVVAFYQYGWNSDFGYIILAYGVIQALDGNALVPLLFSEVVDLHPVAIIIAVLVFGGVWGFWGVFFAIPLATLVQAILKAWPNQQKSESLGSEIGEA